MPPQCSLCEQMYFHVAGHMLRKRKRKESPATDVHSTILILSNSVGQRAASPPGSSANVVLSSSSNLFPDGKL